MTLAVAIAMAILGVSVAVGLVSVATSHDDPSRAVVGDLVFFSCVGLLVLLGTLHASSATVDAALLASLLGVLATVALSRILTRGKR